MLSSVFEYGKIFITWENQDIISKDNKNMLFAKNLKFDFFLTKFIGLSPISSIKNIYM